MSFDKATATREAMAELERNHRAKFIGLACLAAIEGGHIDPQVAAGIERDARQLMQSAAADQVRWNRGVVLMAEHGLDAETVAGILKSDLTDEAAWARISSVGRRTYDLAGEAQELRAQILAFGRRGHE